MGYPDVINQRSHPQSFVLSMGVERNVSMRAVRRFLVVKPCFVPLMVVEYVVNLRGAIVLLLGRLNCAELTAAESTLVLALCRDSLPAMYIQRYNTT